MTRSELAKKFDSVKYITLYAEDREHVASVLPCGYNNTEGLLCDLATPDGKVLYCGIREDLLEVLIKLFGVKEL